LFCSLFFLPRRSSVPTFALVVLFAGTALYVLATLAAAVGFWRVRRQPPPSLPDPEPSVSIVIPARDEADQIEDCIDRILACDYPKDRLEVIVVDDFSTDATAQRVRASQPAFAGATEPTVRLLQLNEKQQDNGGHKPEAVAHGVEAASGTVVLTTDADCIVGPNWIRSMVRRCTPETPFVAGAVRYRFSHRYFERLQALAFAGLVAFGAGTLGLGLPTYCNSANLAFRRDLLAAVPNVSGERDGAAGDELLLQHVAYGTDRDVAFNADPDAAVTTEPAPDVDTYIHQQARWASMGARYPFLRPRLLVVSMWALHPVLLGACAAALALPAWRQPTIAALLAKMAGDLLLTVPFLKHFDQNDLSRSTIATELMLLVVVPIAGFLGSFGTVEWKGRTLD